MGKCHKPIERKGCDLLAIKVGYLNTGKSFVVKSVLRGCFKSEEVL
jgi:hypothetical protein